MLCWTLPLVVGVPAARRLATSSRVSASVSTATKGPFPDRKVAQMRATQIKGLLLEEVVAYLLRHAGYSYLEIAETVGIAVGSVGVLLTRAEHAFRTIYRRQTHS